MTINNKSHFFEPLSEIPKEHTKILSVVLDYVCIKVHMYKCNLLLGRSVK